MIISVKEKFKQEIVDKCNEIGDEIKIMAEMGDIGSMLFIASEDLNDKIAEFIDKNILDQDKLKSLYSDVKRLMKRINALNGFKEVR